jgi:hypothetical protein
MTSNGIIGINLWPSKNQLSGREWSTLKHSESQWSTVKHSEAQWSTVKHILKHSEVLRWPWLGYYMLSIKVDLFAPRPRRRMINNKCNIFEKFPARAARILNLCIYACFLTLNSGKFFYKTTYFSYLLGCHNVQKSKTFHKERRTLGSRDSWVTSLSITMAWPGVSFITTFHYID